MADTGKALIEKLVQRMDVPAVAAKLRDLEAFEKNVMASRPWMPAAWNTREK